MCSSLPVPVNDVMKVNAPTGQQVSLGAIFHGHVDHQSSCLAGLSIHVHKLETKIHLHCLKFNLVCWLGLGFSVSRAKL